MDCRLSGLEYRVQEFGLVIRKRGEETMEVQAFGFVCFRLDAAAFLLQ